MLIIDVKVNDQIIERHWAQRTTNINRQPRNDEVSEYKTSSGHTISHRYGDGANLLAEKTLQAARRRP